MSAGQCIACSAVTVQEKKEELLHLQKTPKKVTTQKRHQTFDYTTIADRLRTVRKNNDSHLIWCGQTGLRDPNLPNKRKSCVIERTSENL